MEVFENFVAEHNIDPQKGLYMGDDIPDYYVLQKVGLATCPSDAAPEIKSICDYISPLKGGEGCVNWALTLPDNCCKKLFPLFSSVTGGELASKWAGAGAR